MADEEQEKALVLDLKDLPLSGEAIKVKLDCAEPVKTGQGQYGQWNLWFGYVENTKCYEGRKPNQVAVEGYTGKVLFFPTEKLNEKLIGICDGNLDVEVSIKKTVEEGRRGLIRRYVPEKLSEGRAPSGSTPFTPTEQKFLDDVDNTRRTGIEITESVFVQASQDESYESAISQDRAKELYILYTNG